MTDAFIDFVVPRLIMAALAGMLFAQAAVWLQAITHQRVVSPDILGVSSAAIALMLAAALVFHIPMRGLWVFGLLGSVVCMILLLIVVKTVAHDSAYRLVLFGVALNMVLQAIISALLAHADLKQAQFLSFTSGSSYAQSWHQLAVISVPAILLIVLGLFQIRRYQLLQLGQEQLQSIGCSYSRLQSQVLLLACAQVTVAVICMGNLSFIGLLVPNVVYLLLKRHPPWILFAVTVLAAIVMPILQWVAINLFAPLEIPLGLLTSLLGAPIFMLMVFRQKGLL